MLFCFPWNTIFHNVLASKITKSKLFSPFLRLLNFKTFLNNATNSISTWTHILKLKDTIKLHKSNYIICPGMHTWQTVFVFNYMIKLYLSYLFLELFCQIPVLTSPNLEEKLLLWTVLWHQSKSHWPCCCYISHTKKL